MQKFVMKLIKKYNINIKTEKNIKIKECYSNAYYQKIIDENLQLDPIDRYILNSVNYCGINKIKERIFFIKKCPKQDNKNITKFSFEILKEKNDNKNTNNNNTINNNTDNTNNTNNIINNNNNSKNLFSKFYNYSNTKIPFLNQIIFHNETFKKNLNIFNNFFLNEFYNDTNDNNNFNSISFSQIDNKINKDIDN